MSEELKKTIVIEGDSSGAKRALDDVKKANQDVGAAAKQAAQSQEELNQATENTAKASSLYQKAMQAGISGTNKLLSSTKAVAAQMPLLTRGLNGVNGALKLLSAHPILAVITVVVGLITKIIQKIKQSEDMTDRLTIAMSRFQPVITLVNKALAAVADGLVTIIEIGSKAASVIMSIIPGFKKASDEAHALATAEDDLEDKHRENLTKNAEAERDIQKQREILADKENKTLEERKAAAEEMARLIKERGERQLEEAKEELRIAEEKAKLDVNDKATNDRLAAAKAKVVQVQAAINSQNKIAIGQVTQLTREEEANAKAVEAANKAREKALAQKDKYTSMLEEWMKAMRELSNPKATELDKLDWWLDDETKKLDEMLKKGELSQEQYQDLSIKMWEQYNAKRAKLDDDTNKAQLEKYQELMKSYRKTEDKLLQEQYGNEDTKANFKKMLEDRLITTEQYNALLEAEEQRHQEAVDKIQIENEKTYREMYDKYHKKTAIQEEDDTNIANLKQLEDLRKQGVIDEQQYDALIEDEKKRHAQALVTIAREAAEKEIATREEVADAYISNASTAIDAVIDLMSSYGEENEKIAKAAFYMDKALQISQLVIDEIKTQRKIWSGAAVESATVNTETATGAGVAAAPVKAALDAKTWARMGITSALSATTTTAAIAKIASTKFGSKGSGSTSMAGAARAVSSTAPSYTAQAPNSYSETQVSNPTDSRVYVLQSDIYESNRQVQVRQENSRY